MLKIKLIAKQKQTKEGKKFVVFYTFMNLPVRGEEEKGLQLKAVNVSFTADCNNAGTIKRSGTIYVNEEDIDIPSIYSVREDKNGKKKYPSLWIHSFEKFEEYQKPKANQSMFGD